MSHSFILLIYTYLSMQLFCFCHFFLTQMFLQCRYTSLVLYFCFCFILYFSFLILNIVFIFFFIVLYLWVINVFHLPYSMNNFTGSLSRSKNDSPSVGHNRGCPKGNNCPTGMQLI